MSYCCICENLLGKVVFPYATYFNGKIFRYKECTNCGTVVVDPIPGNNDFEFMYSQENYHDSHYSKLNLDSHRKSIRTLQRNLTRVEGFSLLDFGCGNGAFMLAAKEYGCKCMGVEFSQSTINKAADTSGCDVIRFDQLNCAEHQFDVIHIGHVLEHIVDPAFTVTNLIRFLKPNGVFFIEGPIESNISFSRFVAVGIGFIKRFLSTGTIVSYAPYHLTMTNKKSQLDFFVIRLKLECVYFSIKDTGGSYSNGDIRTIAGCTKRVISYFSIALSRLFPQLGDVFVAILRPAK